MSFLFIDKTLQINNLKYRTATNAKMSVFVICVDVIIYLLLYGLHDCTFKIYNLYETLLGKKFWCNDFNAADVKRWSFALLAWALVSSATKFETGWTTVILFDHVIRFTESSIRSTEILWSEILQSIQGGGRSHVKDWGKINSTYWKNNNKISWWETKEVVISKVQNNKLMS